MAFDVRLYSSFWTGFFFRLLDYDMILNVCVSMSLITFNQSIILLNSHLNGVQWILFGRRENKNCQWNDDMLVDAIKVCADVRLRLVAPRSSFELGSLLFSFSFSFDLSCSFQLLLCASLELLLFWCFVCMRALMLMMMGCCVFTNFVFIQQSAYKSSTFMATTFLGIFETIPNYFVFDDLYIWNDWRRLLLHFVTA